MKFLIFSLFVFFGLSFIGILTKKNLIDTQQLLLKWLVYILIVGVSLSSIYYNFYPYIFVFIGLIGFYEIFKLKILKRKKIIFLILFVSMVCFSIYFITNISKEHLSLLVVSVFLFDGYAQFFGRLFGKTKITKISPNKTWEGFFMALIVLLIHHVLWSFYNNLNVLNIIIFSIIFSILSLIGDLFFSYLKRLNNVKDFSQNIPGHGGVLDRFDALIFVSFVFGISIFCKSIFDANVVLFIYILLFLIIFLIAEILYNLIKI